MANFVTEVLNWPGRPAPAMRCNFGSGASKIAARHRTPGCVHASRVPLPNDKNARRNLLEPDHVVLGRAAGLVYRRKGGRSRDVTHPGQGMRVAIERRGFATLVPDVTDDSNAQPSIKTAQSFAFSDWYVADNLLHLVLAKVRDEIGDAGFDALHAMFSGSRSAESTEAVRRLLSVWYYYFPADDYVRRGDLIDLDENGDLGLVITPPCDLVRFPKKTGRRLTWLRALRLDANGAKVLENAGIKISEIGGSIIGQHGTTGDTVILLPNVPLMNGSRDNVADYVVLCHGWESRLYELAPTGSLSYKSISPFTRRCTLADPYASGVISKIMAVISSPGTPDLPQGERDRLKTVVAIQPTPPVGSSTSSKASEEIAQAVAITSSAVAKAGTVSPTSVKTATAMADARQVIPAPAPGVL